MRAGRDDDLTDRVIEIIGIVASDAIALSFVPPEHDDTVVLVRSHDHGNDLREEVIALADLSGIAGQAFVTRSQCSVLIVVLVGGYPVVVGNAVVRQIGEKLLQRFVVGRQRVGGGHIIAAVGISEEQHRVVFGGVV